MDEGEQSAAEQLRAIATAVKNCPAIEMPPGMADYDQMVAEGFVFTDGPPQNVVWNVERRPTTRGRYGGTIEFTEASSLRPPLNTDYCNKHGMDKSKCRHIWSLGWQIYRRQADHPHEFRYEFDITSQGLELSRVFKKTEQADDESWVSGGQDSDGCASRSIKSVLDSSSPKPERRAGIPEEIWSAAIRGDADSQFMIGTMYEKGTLVPQDYVEAFFWFDLAASGKTEIIKSDDVAIIRDHVASHLTATVLLQTQERARKWFEEHPAKVNPQ